MNVEIAERLAARRKELGYSQEALAEKLGVSRQAVSKWERSESSPDTDNLIALAQLYGVSLDELLYVDGEIQDDVVFEAADRAAQRKAEEQAKNRPSFDQVIEEEVFRQMHETIDEGRTHSKPETAESDGQQESKDYKAAKEKVHIGLGGIHVEDGDDTVHISWKDGVKVKSKDGDNVSVGWDGVHVKEAPSKSAYLRDDENTFVWTEDGVEINGEHFDSMREARKKYKHGHLYTDKGGKIWLRFPFYLLAIIAYIAIGYATGVWGLSLFVFATIPFYYMTVHYVYKHSFGEYIAGLYPYATLVWFFWMGFAYGAWHPAWVIFLTIPIVEWVVYSITRSRDRKKRKSEVIDVENKSE